MVALDTSRNATRRTGESGIRRAKGVRNRTVVERGGRDAASGGHEESGHSVDRGGHARVYW